MSKLFWYQNFSGGMDQSTDTALVENNESPLLKNVTLDQLGNWSSRKGTVRLDTGTPPAGRVWGLGAYNKSDGTHLFFRVCARDLEKFDGTNDWDAVDTDEWTASKKVNMINFLDRLYLGCEDGTTALAYTTTTTITDVTPTIGGHILAVNKSMLAVGGGSLKPNVIFFSEPYTDQFFRRFSDGAATATCGANADVGGAGTVTTTAEVIPADCDGTMLYNSTIGAMNMIIDWTDADTVTTDAVTSTWDDDTIYMLKNNFTQEGLVTGMIGFQENFVSWDEDNMYLWDPLSQWSQKLPGFGCVNERTPQLVDGNLIWVDREGVFLYGGEGRPIDITGKLRDKVDGYGVWDLIKEANWVQLAAGSFEGKYYLSVGDLGTQAGSPVSTLTNIECVFDVKKGAWTINSRDDEPMCYATFIGRGTSTDDKDLYYGEKTNECVYRMNTGTTDAISTGGTASAIAVEARTPHFVFNDPTQEWRISKYFVKYKASSTVTVTQSKSKGSYVALDTLAASSTVTIVKILPVTESHGHSFSLKFATTGTFTLEGVGFVAERISFGSVAT